MSSEPILVIKDNDSTIGIRARVGEEFSEHEIQLNVILAYYWDNVLKNYAEHPEWYKKPPNKKEEYRKWYKSYKMK